VLQGMLSIRTLFSFFNFGFFQRYPNLNSATVNCQNFSAAKMRVFDLMVGFVLESSSRFSAEQTES